MAKIVNAQIPMLGLNTVNPYVDFNSGYARELTNYAILNGKLIKRPAVRIHTASLIDARNAIWFDPNTNNAIARNGDIFTVTTDVVTGTIGAGTYYTRATRAKHRSLDLIFGVGVPRTAISPFTAWSFTTVSMTATNIIAGVSHKGRLYVTDGTSIEYSPVAAISGAMTANVNLTELLDNQKIIKLASLTVQTGNQAENVFVLFCDGGKVLIYQGDYPASQTWYLIGKFDMPAPVGNQGFVEIDGDIFVATDRYGYWVRDLFAGGAQSAYFNSPTLPIENMWQTQSWGSYNDYLNREHSHVFYIPVIDAIVCQCKQQQGALDTKIADYGNEAIYFVYFRKYKAWSIWFMSPFFAPVVQDANNGTLYAMSYGNIIYQLQCTRDYADVGSADADEQVPSAFKKIETSWKTPYFEAFAGKINKVTGVRPYFADSTAGKFNKIRVIADFSDLNAPYGFFAQSTVPPLLPAKYADTSINEVYNPSNHYGIASSITLQGGAISLQLTQSDTSTATTNHLQAITGVAIYVDDGGIYI